MNALKLINFWNLGRREWMGLLNWFQKLDWLIKIMHKRWKLNHVIYTSSNRLDIKSLYSVNLKVTLLICKSSLCTRSFIKVKICNMWIISMYTIFYQSENFIGVLLTIYVLRAITQSERVRSKHQLILEVRPRITILESWTSQSTLVFFHQYINQVIMQKS